MPAARRDYLTTLLESDFHLSKSLYRPRLASQLQTDTLWIRSGVVAMMACLEWYGLEYKQARVEKGKPQGTELGWVG